MDTHRELAIWSLVRQLVRDVHQVAKALPREESSVAVGQLRRAAWSVHNNIAEGNAKLGRAERRRFLDIALGSLAEIDAMITTLSDLYSLDQQLVEEIQSLRRRLTAGIFRMLRRGR